MLNTAGINNLQFDTVLTAPRACRFQDAAASISAIEHFLQAKYSVAERFMFTGNFRPLIKDELPAIRYRIGLQAIKEEDRRILDYSELITNLDTGGGRKFIDMITRYVEGSVTNTADAVDEDFRQKYPYKSIERLAPQHLTIPLRLNDKQKRILTAVENQNNEIIVVDGPPGTGKSYTICAMIYLANQMGKSVVLTSHKKQALDVIDEALTEQFKKLHPRSKPSVLRLEKERGAQGLNSLENSLATQVINAARDRLQQINYDAVARDRERVHNGLEQAGRQFWESAGDYEKLTSLVFEWSCLYETIVADLPEPCAWVPSRVDDTAALDFARFRQMCTNLQSRPLTLSLEGLSTLYETRNDLPQVLDLCEQLNRMGVSVDLPATNATALLPESLDEFSAIVNSLLPHLEQSATLQEIRNLATSDEAPVREWPDISSYKQLTAVLDAVSALAELEAKLLGKLFQGKNISKAKDEISRLSASVFATIQTTGAGVAGAAVQNTRAAVLKTHKGYRHLTLDYCLSGLYGCPVSSLAASAETLCSLRFAGVFSALKAITGKNPAELPIVDLPKTLSTLQSARQYGDVRGKIRPFADLCGLSMDDLAGVYARLQQVQEYVATLEQQDIATLSTVFLYFGDLLQSFGIHADNLGSLAKLSPSLPIAEKLFRFIELHIELSRHELPTPPSRHQFDEFFTKSQKLLGYWTDRRLNNLVSHTGHKQQILHTINAGQRMSVEQAKILLESLSCIIAEPGLLSRHFPMESDMIDLLIIDEASQVSIAESISLMLRAKQTVVFGDELQYGAVGAVNVSQHYATYFFKDILREYAQERNQPMSESEQEQLAREAISEPPEDDEMSCGFYRVSAGTREWLKTFSVRTSTLAFAKALSNYSESLNVHFRSFPEIISYSNEYFYRQSQIELITNRIRTKPIHEVLRFLPVVTQGTAGNNINLDEADAIKEDLAARIAAGYCGSIGVICSFREQVLRVEEMLRKELPVYPDLVRKHRFKVWFVGDVQGEERDLIYYSFVQDKKQGNADLKSIYPTIGGTADTIHSLKMQRLNVGFSRAKDIMVFVHSMDIGEYSDTRLGDALRHYQTVLQSAQDHYIEDESVFGSEAEKELYSNILQTAFFERNRNKLRLIAQFEIGKYIREQYHRSIPRYRVDFLLTKTNGGKEKSLIIEYDGLEFHTKNPDMVTKHNFDQEYLEYDIERQLELESYGYSFLRINKFSLVPRRGKTKIDVLDTLLEQAFAD